tara:strand:- start:3226 stop:3882 length:657 start_codon:yes stop_codon:yes gene_type:complete
MSDYTPTTDLKHFPGLGPAAMLRYGTNPYGEALWRIVFADSRKHLVTGTWGDGSVGAKWRPRYRQASGFWVLEKWLSAAEYHKMPREKWDLMYPSLPFQDRGDYDHAFTFEACGPVHASIDKLIMWIEASKRASYQDDLDACHRDYAQEEKDTSREMMDRVGNSLPAFGSTAMVSGHGNGRGTKTARVLKTANELNLPIGNNKFNQGRKRQAFEVPLR